MENNNKFNKLNLKSMDKILGAGGEAPSTKANPLLLRIQEWDGGLLRI